MNRAGTYVIKFTDPVWTRTAPDGSASQFPTLQAAVESAKILTTRKEDGADVVWFDHEGDEQGRWKGWKHR